MLKRPRIVALLRRALMCVLSIVICPVPSQRLGAQSGRSPDALQIFAAQAKKEGKTTYEVSTHWDLDDASISLDEVLRVFSVVVVTPSADGQIQVVTPDSIFTWRRAHVDRVVSQRGVLRPELCALPAPGHMVLGASDFALRTVGGAASVSNIAITLTSPESGIPFEPNRHYALVGIACSNKTFVLGFGAHAVFSVAQDGGFDQNQEAIVPWADRMRLLGSVDGLQRYLKR